MSEEQNVQPGHPHHIPAGKIALLVIVMTVVVVAVWLGGYLPHRDRENAAVAAAKEVADEVPLVTTAIVRQAVADVDIVLPGSVTAVSEASIYARAPGYVRKRLADIGDHVKAGQILAELDTPDLDQEVAQARAALGQAKQQLGMARASLVQAEAQRDLAKATLARYEGLVKDGAVARQEYETQVSSGKSAEALVTAQQANVSGGQDNVSAAQANLDRVIALQEFKNVRSPLAGVVTVRNVDVGYLISANGGGQGSSPSTQSGTVAATPAAGNEMFRVAQIGTLRVFVGVPQSAASAMHPGMTATLTFADRPGKEYQAKVTRTSGTLDPTARTLLTELQLPNADGKLFPGMYASVHFRNHRDSPPPTVRGDALITSASGMQVAVLTDAAGGKGLKKIHLTPVQPGRDYGADLEILSGVVAGQQVVVNPSDLVREGVVVRPYAAPGAAGGSGRGAGR